MTLSFSLLYQCPSVVATETRSNKEHPKMLHGTGHRNTISNNAYIPQFIQKNPTSCNSVLKFIISYLLVYEAQHVSDDTPPIIRSLKLH